MNPTVRSGKSKALERMPEEAPRTPWTKPQNTKVDMIIIIIMIIIIMMMMMMMMIIVYSLIHTKVKRR